MMQVNSTIQACLFSPKFAETLAWWERLDWFTRRRSPDPSFEVQPEQLSDCRFCLAPVMPIFSFGRTVELDVVATDDQGTIRADPAKVHSCPSSRVWNHVPRRKP
jgi:hypothetical protein